MEHESQEPRNGRDLVAALIRAAGRRTEPPTDAYLQVLTAATAAFREKTAKRRTRNVLLWAAAASVAAIAITLSMQWNIPSTKSQIATVARVVGSAELATDGDWQPMTRSSGGLERGARLRTLAGGGVALALDGGASLRLAAATEVQLDGPRRILLRSGKLYLDNFGSVGTGYQIETPAGTARDVGTQFELRVNDGVLRLRVREGSVEIDRAGRHIGSSAGEQLDIDVLGGVTRSSIAATDAEWQWVETIAPAPDIEGKPASVLLTWVARETGRQLHYESTTAENRAATVILHGNIRHLAPLAALDVMLATTDLEYSLIGDTMEVRTRNEH
ncbi:MAG: FecR family protein [Gammaproteobacteria bacterium]|nr:FecR family protein [Gammaproteobacteria bacterium]